ncbi:restriction endonuclease subunit S [Pseudomonas sp.]|uniref:restriction endonuclease subunit S n=1 Tax=Pseudomonas sp. TaxID=306 RepID=UPI0032656DBA
MSALPPGWVNAPVEDLIAGDGIFSDGDWIESKDQDPNGSIRLLQLADVGDGVFANKSNRFVNEEKFLSLRCTEVLANDVLVARMPEPLGRACLAPHLSKRCITVVDVAILRPGESSVNPRWLMHFLNAPSIRQHIELQSSGTTRRRITRKNLAKIVLPVPPLAEQKRIVLKLDSMLQRISECKDRIDRVAEVMKNFRRAVLDAATSGELTREWRRINGEPELFQSFGDAEAEYFGDYHFPASWSKRRLSDVAVITGGVTKDSKKQDAEFVELPYLRVANVQRGYLDLSEIKTIRVPPNKVADLTLQVGDILFNEGGDIDKLGRGWVWDGQLPTCVFQNHVFRARLLDGEFESRYFSWYGNSRGYHYFLSQGKQTTNLASINKSVLSALPVAIPPAAEQLEIVRRVGQLFRFAERMEASCAGASSRINALSSSAINRAFRGDLVPQCSTDTPASVILANITASKATTVPPTPDHLPKIQSRRAIMTKTNKDAVKAAVLEFETGRFSFDELRVKIPGDYESIKNAVFELLSETKPLITQVFDKASREMRFVRVEL